MPAVRVSRGRLTSLWVILRTLQKLDGAAETSELLKVAGRSGLRAGGLPIADGLVLASKGGFVQEADGRLTLGRLGKHALALDQEDEPTPILIRLFTAVLLFDSPPPWVAWWQGSPDDLREVISSDERRVLQDAKLYPLPSADDDPAGWAWWRALARVPRLKYDSSIRKQVGDAGEELTLAYERDRLNAQGYTDLAQDVAWLARESDAYGFDVLSFAGDDFDAASPSERIAIEVKSTSLPQSEKFSLYLSAHEWEVASGLGSRSILHLWSGVSPGPPPQSAADKPIVVPASSLVDHLPLPPLCNEACRWQSAHLRVTTDALGVARVA